MLSQVIEDGEITQSYFTADPLTLNTINADALILGSSTTEGGDIKVYRDASGNLQMSLDADAASNVKALDIYGGVVAQNYLTVGQNTLNTSYPFYSYGLGYFNDGVVISSSKVLRANFIYSHDNASTFTTNISVTGTNATDHAIKLQIDGNDIIVAQATGDGAGGITDKTIGLYGITPTTQATTISDPAESIAANNTAIDSILAALRGIGLIAT